MKAFILAAGRGERLRPLTDHTPKPLIEISGKPLIVHHLERLAAADIKDVVINLHHLGEKIRSYLGDGQTFGLKIHYMVEEELLETGGSCKKALEILGEKPFLLINGDIFTDFPFEKLPRSLPENTLGHLIMVPTPIGANRADFILHKGFLYLPEFVDNNIGAKNKFTYSGISILHPHLVQNYPEEKFMLLDVFKPAILALKMSGEFYGGQWFDVGTPERLKDVQERVQATLIV